MDIVSRIKRFMESVGLSSSQLADTCDIPRPTMSQILNGRSKKISDDLISRLHSNFPQLSIMWLLFGEGNMLNSENIKSSAPEKADKSEYSHTQNTDNQINFTENAFDINTHNLNSEKPGTKYNSLFDDGFDRRVEFNRIKEDNTTHQGLNTSANRQTDRVPEMPEAIGDFFGTLSSSGDQSSQNEVRSVSAIMVFYSDNSYEMFTPSSGK